MKTIKANNLPLIEKPQLTETPGKHPAVQKAAKMYEKHFLREMVRQMRKTVNESGLLKKNMAEKFFQEKLDHKYVDSWGDQGGIGLADLIYRQIMDRYMHQQRLVRKPSGPIPLQDDSKQFQMKILNKNHPAKPTTIEFKKTPDQSSTPVSAPWSGNLAAHHKLSDGTQVLRLEHDNGLHSTLAYKGQSESFASGQTIREGQTLGQMSPQATSLFWNING